MERSETARVQGGVGMGPDDKKPETTMTTTERKRSYRDGRDEMNLADFPISVLQRQQPCDQEGRKLDRMEFEASRYDPATRQRVHQRVTLTTTARDGLPTPADEHVILALLYVAKHSTNFDSPEVHFAPGQLFEIMGWAPNGRSYDRLRDVLRRLKSLTIRYENAWWDITGRSYEEEVATGIISGYRIARQTSGPRKPDAVSHSWVTWTQQFHSSLLNGNLKRLDLDLFFKLRTPTAQRMYRFLDKRFYNATRVSMDLIEFACGHIGLTETHNVAQLKRRLAPAIKELEEIGFLAATNPNERFEKVKAGIWRIHFYSASTAQTAQSAPQSGTPGKSTSSPEVPPTSFSKITAPQSPAEALASEFYRLWAGAPEGQRGGPAPGGKDVQQAESLLREHGAEAVHEMLPILVRIVRKEWPACRSFSGAVQKYLSETLKAYEVQLQRTRSKQAAEERREQERAQEEAQQKDELQLQKAWEALPEQEQQDIRNRVLDRLGGTLAPRAFIHRLCLEALQSRHEN